MCQRPKRALFISTEDPTQVVYFDSLGVNALNGLSSFLLLALFETTVSAYGVSTP